jgi:hypothetical protein
VYSIYSSKMVAFSAVSDVVVTPSLER